MQSSVTRTGSLAAAAAVWHEAGCAVIPASTDGSKAPAVAWRRYMRERPSEDQLDAWFAGGDYDGLGIVCGAASGGLEMLELEGRAVTEGVAQALAEALADHGLAEAWARMGAYREITPSGGMHCYFRVADGAPRRNTKLARRPSTPEELAAHPGERVQVLIETRGEGGFSVVAPSGGRTHPTGAAWTALACTPFDIGTVTAEERDAVYAVASMLDAMPVHDEPAPGPGNKGTGQSGSRPGDEFNAKATWDRLLGDRGWTCVRRFHDGSATWRRPGKDSGSISATTGRTLGLDGADRLYVFTTSTDLEPERPYTKFAFVAATEHDGDFAAAAKALRAAGYGHEPEHPREPAPAAPVWPETPAQPPEAAQPAPAATEPVVLVSEPATYTLSDDGNALRLVDTVGAVARYCPERASWLMWDEHRWRTDTAGTIHEHARAIARALPNTEQPDQRHRKNSLSARGLAAMVHVARTDPRIVVAADRLDATPHELNTPAGIVDLRTGSIRPADPTALHTRSTTVAPDFDAEPTRWLRFLAETFAGDPALTTYVQRLLGLSLIGEVRDAVLPFAWGMGANGKSTLLNIAQHLLGMGEQGYALAARAEILLAGAPGQHPTELASLAGARLVVTSELEDGQRFAEARIKLLTGKDYLTARFMRQDFFSWAPTHTIWLLANEKPAVRTGGPAFWRRLRLLPFEHTVPETDRIAGLDDQLVDAEGPAILAWMIRGAADYYRAGLAEPASVVAATKAYESDQDTVARFVDERCVLGPQGQQGMAVINGALRAAYETWCRREGETPVGPKTLTQLLRSRYDVGDGRTNATRYYTGIRLVGDDDAPPEPVQGRFGDGREGW